MTTTYNAAAWLLDRRIEAGDGGRTAYVVDRASTDYAGATDREALIGTISNPENRYLARNMCWVLSIEGLETDW